MFLATRVRKNPCVQCLLCLRKKERVFRSVSMVKTFRLNVGAYWVHVYYKFTIDVTY